MSNIPSNIPQPKPSLPKKFIITLEKFEPCILNQRYDVASDLDGLDRYGRMVVRCGSGLSSDRFVVAGVLYIYTVNIRTNVQSTLLLIRTNIIIHLLLY